MKKKLIFITEALWIGGIETALVNLLNRLDYAKYDVTCLVLRGSLELAGRITPQCRLLVADRDRTHSFSQAYRFSRLYHLTEESETPSRLHRALMWTVPALRWIENRLYIRYIRLQLKGEPFDTCVIYSDRAAETAVRAIRADRYLLFYHHGAMRKAWHDEIGYRKAERIIAVSGAIARKLGEFRPEYAEKILTIHNLTDVDGICARAEEPIPEAFSADSYNIVSCGRVAYEKGMDLAVEACAELVKRGHRSIHWWIVGGGPAEAQVRERIAQLHMEDHVTLLGMRENPYPYIRRADLYVQPSRFESYGLTIAEAMVLGTPIVSTETDGAKELICHSRNGLLCQTNAQAIGQAVRMAMETKGTQPDCAQEILERNQAVQRQIDVLLQEKGNEAKQWITRI